MKLLFAFVLCCSILSVYGQFQQQKSSTKVYTVEDVKLPVFKPQFTIAVNTSAQKSLLLQPQSNYVPSLTIATGGNTLGSTYYYTTKKGTTVLYTFDEMGNYNGSTITFKEKEQRKKSDKKKFRH